MHHEKRKPGSPRTEGGHIFLSDVYWRDLFLLVFPHKRQTWPGEKRPSLDFLFLSFPAIFLRLFFFFARDGCVNVAGIGN